MSKKGKFGLGLLLGAAVGAVAGILTAPKSGKETREDLKNKGKELAEAAKAKGEEISKTKLSFRNLFLHLRSCSARVFGFFQLQLLRFRQLRQFLRLLRA